MTPEEIAAKHIPICGPCAREEMPREETACGSRQKALADDIRAMMDEILYDERLEARAAAEHAEWARERDDD